MTTMVERVRNAILKARFYDCEPQMYESLDAFIETIDPEHLHDAEYEARAAIEAMREEDLRLELAKRRFDNSYTIDDEGCFVWLGAVDRRDGYGRFYDGSGKTQTAYGFAWRYHFGEVPEGMVLDHICRNRRCVNHTHLRIVTNAANVLIGNGITAKNASKTHCAHGHPLSGENLYVRPNGERDCRECRLEASRRHRARKRAIDAALNEGVSE